MSSERWLIAHFIVNSLGRRGHDIFLRIKWNGIGNDDDDDDDQNKSKGIAEGNGSVEYIYLFISSSLTTQSSSENSPIY